MTSINTNVAAMAALAANRSLSVQLLEVQSEAATGLRVRTATDNSAYWSIATTMRSDNKVMSSVADALQMAAARADVAYSAMDQTKNILVDIRAKLVLAMGDGVDKAKVQREIELLAAQTVDLAKAATLGGANWLNTSVPDLFETTLEARADKIISAFERKASGGVSLQTFVVDQLATSLFNEQGGGILQGDPRSPHSIGGLRLTDLSNSIGYTSFNGASGNQPVRTVSFDQPVVFSASDEFTFWLTLDEDNDQHNLPGPLHPGTTPKPITIDKALVDAALGRGDGTVRDAIDAQKVLSLAVSGSGASAGLYHDSVSNGYRDDLFYIQSSGSGLDGAYLRIDNVSGTVAFGDLGATDIGGGRFKETLSFEPFKIYKDVVVTFDFDTHVGTTTSHVVDRALVDSLLGKEDGRVDTIDEMIMLVEHLLLSDHPYLVIENNGSNGISISTDPNVDRIAGSRSRSEFSNISVNIEPIPQMGILDVDIEASPHLVEAYLWNVDSMLGRVIDGAAYIGAIRKRIELQSAFNSVLTDSMSRGIGRLVDADMSEVSVRLQALQVQKQLAVQSLALASAEPQALLRLFG